jgi:hypothetical protein
VSEQNVRVHGTGAALALAQHVHSALDVIGIETFALLHQRYHLSEQRRNGLTLGRRSLDRDLVAPNGDDGLELVLDQPEQAILLAQQIGHVQLRWDDETYLRRL